MKARRRIKLAYEKTKTFAIGGIEPTDGNRAPARVEAGYPAIVEHFGRRLQYQSSRHSVRRGSRQPQTREHYYVGTQVAH